MWNTNKSEAPAQPQAPSTSSHTPDTRPASAVAPPGVPSASTFRPSAPVARDLATLGASLTIKGQIIGEEDLQIEGKIDGPVTLNGHRLIVGRSANLNSEISAREVIVYGKALGNLYAKDRVEIKKDGEVMGDISTSRISIEDGAYFKGRIEIERKHKNDGKSEQEMSRENTPVGVAN